MKNIMLLGFLAALVFSACIRKECQVPNGGYLFEIPVTLSPAKDTFNVGDTISIVSEFSDEVFERNTQRTYKLEDFVFGPTTIINKIDTSDAITSSITNNFEFISIDSFQYNPIYFSNGAQYLMGNYLYKNNSYRLKYQLVVKKSGLYIIKQASDLYPFQDQGFEEKCDRLEMESFANMNDGADNNIHLLNDSPDPHFNEWIPLKPQERFYKPGSYCFYVK